MHACMSKNFMVFDVDCSMIVPALLLIDDWLGSKATVALFKFFTVMNPVMGLRR
jgi:hypothetical protein